MADETSFIQKIKSAPTSKKLVAGGGGLSVAAIIYLNSVYATRTEVAKMSQAQAAQWQEVGRLRDKTDQQIDQLTADVNYMKGENNAYRMVIYFLKAGTPAAENDFTNKQPWTKR